MKKIVLSLTAVAFALSACTTIDETTGSRVKSNTKTGAIIGAVVGAGVGAISHKDGDERRKNAMIGAGIGALAGAAVGQYMDLQTKELRKKMAGTGVEVKRVGDDVIVSMPGDLTFATDSADIESRFYTVLDNVATVLNTYPATYIDIVGHADAQGSDEYNMALSERRANAAAGYLVSHQVKAERVYVAGMGEAQPIATNETAEGRAKNRRVEIRLRPMKTD